MLLKMKKTKWKENTHLNLIFFPLMYEKLEKCCQFPMSFAINGLRICKVILETVWLLRQPVYLFNFFALY